MSHAVDNALLLTALQAAVPLHALGLRGRSWDEVRRIGAECAQVIAEHGDDVLYKSRKPGGSARAFNALARGLAALSFVPGGVRFAGLHFEHHLEKAR